jgi:hypothetical protein
MKYSIILALFLISGCVGKPDNQHKTVDSTGLPAHSKDTVATAIPQKAKHVEENIIDSLEYGENLRDEQVLFHFPEAYLDDSYYAGLGGNKVYNDIHLVRLSVDRDDDNKDDFEWLFVIDSTTMKVVDKKIIGVYRGDDVPPGKKRVLYMGDGKSDTSFYTQTRYLGKPEELKERWIITHEGKIIPAK